MDHIRINYRFVGVLSFLLILGGMGVFLLHRRQIGRTSEIVLSLAREAVTSGQTTEAIHYYRRYLGLSKDDPVARAELGCLLAGAGDFERAFFEFETALRFGPQLHQTRQELVGVAIALGRFDDARLHLTQHLIVKDPNEPEFHYQLGRCEKELGNLAASRERLKRAVELAPDSPTYADALAEILVGGFSDLNAARETLDRLVRSAPKSPDAYLARGNWLLQLAIADGNLSNGEGRQETRLEQSWDDARRAMELDPDLVAPVILATDVAMSLGRGTEVRPVVMRFIRTHPQSPELHVRLAKLDLEAGRRENAIKSVRRGLAAIPDHLGLMLLLAHLELDTGRVSSASKLLAKLKERDPCGPIAFLEARTLAAQGRWHEASDLIRNSSHLFVKNDELRIESDRLQAECQKRLGAVDQQIAALGRIASIDPLNARAREALAEALVQAGRPHEALIEYRKLLGAQDPPASVLVAIAQLQLLEAIRFPDELRQWRDLDQTMSRLEALSDAANEVAILRAEILLARYQFDSAAKQLEDRIEIDATSLPVHRALTELHARNRSFGRAFAVLQRAEEVFPDSSELRLDRARLLVRRDGPNVDIDLLEQLAAPNPDWTPDEASRVALQFSGVLLSLGDYERAEHYAKVAASLGQEELSIQLLLLELAYHRRDALAMIDPLARVKDLVGPGPVWRLGEALRLCVKAEESRQDPLTGRDFYDDAIMHLTEARIARSEWARIPHLLGQIYDLQDRDDLAIEHYMKALSLGDSSPEMSSRVAFLLYESGRFVEADQVIRTLQQLRVPTTEGLREIATQVSLELNDPERAIELAKNWADQSQNPRDRVWLAQVYAITGHEVQAELELRKAIELQPSLPSPWVSLVQHYGRMGDVEAARRTVDEAKSKIRPESRSTALAQACESIYDYKQAEHHYLNAYESSPTSEHVLQMLARYYLTHGEREQAIPYLEQLIATSVADKSQTRLWARRQLALTLGISDRDSAHERAIQLIQANSNELGTSVEDQRVMAAILGARSDFVSNQRAVEILREIVSDQPPYSLSDRHQLADLLRRTGDWNQYSQTMRSLLGHGGANDPRYIRLFANALIERGEIEEAQIWTSRLEQLSISQLAADTVVTRMLFAAGDYSRLEQILRSHAEPETTTDRELLWSAEGAEFFGSELSRAGVHEPGKQLLELAAKWHAGIEAKHPERPLALASFYLRQGNVAHAVKLSSNANATPEQLVDLCRQAIETGKVDESHAATLIETLRNATTASTFDDRLWVCLGDL